MKELVNRYNMTFLSGENDFKLVRRHLWRIFFRRQYERNQYFWPKNISLSHQAIYIQNRHNQPDEPVEGVQKRKKAVSLIPIGSDYSKITHMSS